MMKRILFFLLCALCVLPQLANAQMDVATYNKERHQLINYHTNSDGNLKSVAIIDKDMTTIMLNAASSSSLLRDTNFKGVNGS